MKKFILSLIAFLLMVGSASAIGANDAELENLHLATCSNPKYSDTELESGYAHSDSDHMFRQYVLRYCKTCGAEYGKTLISNRKRNVVAYEYLNAEKHRIACSVCDWYYDAKHIMENGECKLCDIPETGCDHDDYTDNAYYAGEYEIEYSKIKETTHDAKHPYRRTCDDCGEVLKEGHFPAVTEKHSFKNGVCACGYEEETECQHKYYTDEEYYGGKYQTEFSKIMETTHDVKNPYRRTCDDCGEVLKEGHFPAVTEKHTFKNGVCACGYEEETEECTTHDFRYSECQKCGFIAYIILSKDTAMVGDTIKLSTNLPKGDYTFRVGKNLSLSGTKATAVAAGKGNVWLYYKGGSNSVASCVVEIECEEHTAMTKRSEVEYHDDGNTHTVITTTYGVCTCGFEGVIERTYESVEHEDKNFNGECDRCGGAVKQYFFDVPAYQKTKGAFVKYGGEEYPISFPSFDTSTYSNYDLTYGGWVTVYEDSYRVDSYDFAGLISGLDLDSQAEPNAGGASIPQPGKMGTAGYNTDSASFGSGNSSINVASGLISAGYQAVDNWNVELFKVVLQEKEDDPSQRRTVLMLGNTDVPRQGYVESTKILSSMCYGNFAFYGNLPEGISITDSAAIADWIIRKSGVPLPTGASSDNTDYQYDLIVSPSVDWYEKQESYNKYISFDEDGNAFIIERIMENDTYVLVGYYMNSLADETYLRNFMAPDVYTNMKDYMLMPTPVDVSEFLTKIEDDGKLEINY